MLTLTWPCGAWIPVTPLDRIHSSKALSQDRASCARPRFSEGAVKNTRSNRARLWVLVSTGAGRTAVSCRCVLSDSWTPGRLSLHDPELPNFAFPRMASRRISSGFQSNRCILYYTCVFMIPHSSIFHNSNKYSQATFNLKSILPTMDKSRHETNFII